MRSSDSSDSMNTSSSPSADNAWHRVSPVSLFYFAFSAAKQAINLWPALIALWAGGDTIQQFFWDYGLAAIVIVALLSLWMHYWFFRYKEDEDCIQIRSGLLNRKRLTLYFERVQQADIIQPFYFRPFGLSTLGLESAGSGQQEVDIPGIPYQAAEQIKTKILRYKKRQLNEHECADTPSQALAEPHYQLHLPPLEVARYGLMHNGLLFLLPVIGVFSQQSSNVLKSLAESLQETWLLNAFMEFTYQSQGWLVTLGVLFLLLGGIAALFGLSVIIALVRFWNYSLVHEGDQFQYRAGLGTVKTRGFRLHKLQKITISQGIIARLLRRYSLVVSKAGSSVHPGQELHNDAKKFIVPVLNEQGLSGFLQQLQCPSAVNTSAVKEWAPISRFYIVWWSAWVGTIVTGFTIVLLSVGDYPLWPAVLVFFGIVAIVWRHWYCYGVFQTDDWLAVKTGFIGRKIVIIPTIKTQKITISQPPWLRRQWLANLLIWSGGGLVVVPHLPQAFARTTRDDLLKRVISTQRRFA